MKTIRRKLISVIVLLAMLLTSISGTCMTVFAEEEVPEGIVKTYGDYTFTKISNPTTGSKQPDGINTNDPEYGPNRLNSYAWAVASRGDSIYIGTNRTLFGSALNAVAEGLKSDVLTPEALGNVVTMLTGGDVPVNLAEEDYIPQIIKFNVADGTSKVIYQPATAKGEDGRLYYLDKDGNIIPNADVSSETASYRSVVQFKDNLYYGSLGTNMLQLVRIDPNDKADVVFQTIGLVSSLRAGCVHDAGDGETVYFGGQDTTYLPWRQHRQANPDDSGLLPIVIRYLDPETAGTDHEDWSGMVADFTDFGDYARASVYASGGGNVWDLCSYNGKLYLILAYDGGWAMFRGEKGGANPNKFGWTWTEIVGNNGSYPLAMNAEVAQLNEQYRKDYGCSQYTPQLTGTGLLESTATPYVFNGKMYIGSFDNATTIQTQTVFKALTKFQMLTNPEAWKKGNFGPTLTQIFAPIYEVLSHPQHIWVMDENESIAPVESANELLAGTTIDYAWRFIEHNGQLYNGTFDSSTAFIYFLDFSKDRLVSMLKEHMPELPEELQQLLNGDFSEQLKALLSGQSEVGQYEKPDRAVEVEENVSNAAVNAAVSAEEFLDNETSVEELASNLEVLEAAREELNEIEIQQSASNEAMNGLLPEQPKLPTKAEAMIDWLMNALEGVEYWAKARELVTNAEQGFDILTTKDGENWEAIVRDGLQDPYNYGARTFTILNNELYVGTANPYYGAQIWKIEGPFQFDDVKDPSAWFYNDVYRAYNYKNAKGTRLMSGYAGTNLFGPADKLNRASFAVMLHRLADEPDAAFNPDIYGDVKNPDDFFVTSVMWAREAKVITGYENGNFGPSDNITREQIATILYRYAKDYAKIDVEKAKAKADMSQFADAASVSEFAKDAIEWANGAGIITGKDPGDGTKLIDPQGNALRAEVAAMFMRYIAYISEPAE